MTVDELNSGHDTALPILAMTVIAVIVTLVGLWVIDRWSNRPTAGTTPEEESHGPQKEH